MGCCTRRILLLVLLLRIRTLAGEGGGAAATVSQHGLELSETKQGLEFEKKTGHA